MRHLADIGPGVARIALELLFLGGKVLRHRVERAFAAVEQLLLAGDLFRKRGDVVQLAFAHRSHFAQVGDLFRDVGEVARRKNVGQVIVVLIVAVGLAYHFGILRAVALQGRAEVAGDAVRTGYLLAQQARLLLGLLKQLVAGVELACQAANPFLGGGAAFLYLRDRAFSSAILFSRAAMTRFCSSMASRPPCAAAPKAANRKRRVSMRAGFITVTLFRLCPVPCGG